MRRVSTPMHGERSAWMCYYADLFIKTGRKECETLAIWYALLLEEFGE